VIRRRNKSEVWRSGTERAAQQEPADSYGRLFEAGREEELRRTLAAKVYKGLIAPDTSARVRITRIIDNVISEREGGWHFGLSSERLSKDDLRSDDGSARLCADCALPGCCYFDIVRLTCADVERLSARLKLSSEEFVARHCTPFTDARDRRYTHALKQSRPCEFLSEGRCRVYADRPTVCADFPFVVDPTTGDVIEIRLFPFCNLPFNAVRHEVTRRVLEGSQ
jgi:Fe-S-cluster containining protein